jgi:hypothetical protein
MRNDNVNRRKQAVENLRGFLSNLTFDHIENNSNLTILREDVEDAKLVCSTPVYSNKLSYGFTAASSFVIIDTLPIIEAEFQHHNSDLLIKSANANASLQIIFKYQSFVKICYEITKRTANLFDIKLIFTSKHSPIFRAKQETDGDERFLRIPVKNDPRDRFFKLCRSTAFQLCFCLEKSDMEAFFFQLYSLLSCPIVPQSYTESKTEISNVLDEFISDWPWELRYYVEVIKSCGFIGSFFLRCHLFKDFIYNVDGSVNEGITKMYLLSLNEHLKSDLSWSSMILPDHIFDDFASVQNNHNYELLKTAYITPTRIVYTFEETTLNSRGFRMLGLENLLLVKFRDDTLWDFPSDDVDETILLSCQDGIQVAGKQFYEFGGSSSLFRDFGTYFYAIDNKNIIPEIWNQWGTFKVEPAAKVAARIGQYFTSAKILGLTLNQTQVLQIDDLYSTTKDSAGNPYCFSDGVGLIHQEFAKKISQKLKLSYIASAFQIRYAGYKGMISVDPNSPYFEPGFGLYVCFRESQKKFHVESKEDQDFEIVQASNANQASLHRVFIVMLDALAKDQGKQERLHQRLRELQNNAFDEIIKPLVDANAFIEKLEKLPKYIPVSRIRSKNLLINEPFLRSMVEADAVLNARLLSTKSKIKIPPSFGRNALGVVDTSGKLMPGQIYFRYSEDLKIKSHNRKTISARGPVGVTKSPIHHAGDIRFLTAVDIPELHHLIDVVVFPSCGGRPVTDEIGGGDLDGDMYVVFWDPAWLLERNVEAAAYTTPSTNKIKKVDLNKLQEEFPKFRAQYTKENNVEKLDSAHLCHLILHRPDHPDCERLANKADIAVNFFKSGLPAGRLMENERPGHQPKFKDARHDPAFTSSHILCQLHEQADTFYQLIQIAQKEALKQRENQIIAKRNDEITEEDIEEFDEYKMKIEALMKKYQIKSEGELFAKAFFEVSSGDFQSKKKFGENSVTAIVQERVKNIFEEFRTKILDKFQWNWKAVKEANRIDFFDFQIFNVTEEMVSLAKRYYALSEENGKFFSFSWIVWEGLDAWWQTTPNRKPSGQRPKVVNPPIYSPNLTNEEKKFYQKAQSSLIKHAFLPNDTKNINLFQQIINYPPFVVQIPNVWVHGFQQNFRILETKSGCKEIAIGVKKVFQNFHYYTIICRGTLEACQKLETLLTPFIEPDLDNTVTFDEMKKKKNQKMQEILENMFGN